MDIEKDFYKMCMTRLNTKIYKTYFLYFIILQSYLYFFSNFVNINVLFFFNNYIYYTVVIYLLLLCLKIFFLNNNKIEDIKNKVIEESKNKMHKQIQRKKWYSSTKEIEDWTEQVKQQDDETIKKITNRNLKMRLLTLLLLISGASWFFCFAAINITYSDIYEKRTNEFAELKINNSKKICIRNINFNNFKEKPLEKSFYVDIYVSYIIDNHLINTSIYSDTYDLFIKPMLNIKNNSLSDKNYSRYELHELSNQIDIINNNVHNKIFCKK